MPGNIGRPKVGLNLRGRIAAAVAIFLAVEIAISFGIAFYGTRGLHNALLWLAPALPTAALLFRGAGARLGAAAALAVLILPAAIASEMLAHIFGTCLY